MTEKLKVSRAIADAIETLGSDRNVTGHSVNAQLHLHAECAWETTERTPLNELSLEELATALIVGYEVEMTSHEVIEKQFSDCLGSEGLSEERLYDDGFADGIEFTLNTLGITVKGVNDNDNNS